MPYETKIQELGDHLRVEVSGARSPGHELEDAVETGLKISEVLSRTEITKVLAIFKMTGRLPPTAAYEIFSNPQDFGWHRDVTLALVDLNEESQEDSFFSETVAVNRAYQMSVFDNEPEAREWLLG